MLNVFIFMTCVLLGGAFIHMGLSLVADRYRRLIAEHIANGTFFYFHYIFGIVLGIGDVIVGVVSLVTAVFTVIYPLY